MSEIKYSTIITYKIKDLIFFIIAYKKMSFINTIEYLIKSKLNESLTNENTKFWHLSSNKLFKILENKKRTKVFNFLTSFKR